MPSLARDYAAFRAETARLAALHASAASLAPKHRKFIAEIALLRLAILIENTLKSVFCKIVCGAIYLDGTAPIVLALQRNAPSALTAMRQLNRPKFRYGLPWNNGREIRDNIEFLIDAKDPAHRQMINYGSFLSEIRFLRNHVAHRNDNSRANFVTLIRKYYGASVPGVTCGNLLLSPRVSLHRPLLLTHIASANIMIKDVMRG